MSHIFFSYLPNYSGGEIYAAASNKIPMASAGSGDPVTQSGEGYVSGLYKCQTSAATYLCMYDPLSKLKDASDYDIGGTYSGTDPEFWFYCTTSPCHGLNYLLNIFVCHRKPGNFSLQISNSTQCTQKVVKNDDATHVVLPKRYDTFTFRSPKSDNRYYIKTFCFGKKLELPNDSVLLIPIKITVDPEFAINRAVVKSIKLQHDLSGLLIKQEKTDFMLESASHKEFPTHKILLAAHSPVLRNMIKNTLLTSLFIDISDNDMELLLEFIYTGAIKDLHNQDCSKLLTIAEQFQLIPLFLFTQHMIIDQIKVENAIEMAVIAKKYQLMELQNKVFDFIIKNPEVMRTTAWNELKDVELTKYLFQYMHMMKD